MSDAITNLVDDRIDFSFRIGQLKDSNLKTTRLISTAPIFCAAPGYLASAGNLHSIEQLLQHKLILPTYLNLSERLRMLFPNQKMINPDDFDSTNDVQALYLRIIEDGGVSMFLDVFVANNIAAGTLIQLFPKIVFPKQPISLVWYQNKLPLKMIVFKKFIQEVDFSEVFNLNQPLYYSRR